MERVTYPLYHLNCFPFEVCIIKIEVREQRKTLKRWAGSGPCSHRGPGQACGFPSKTRGFKPRSNIICLALPSSQQLPWVFSQVLETMEEFP